MFPNDNVSMGSLSDNEEKRGGVFGDKLKNILGSLCAKKSNIWRQKTPNIERKCVFGLQK